MMTSKPQLVEKLPEKDQKAGRAILGLDENYYPLLASTSSDAYINAAYTSVQRELGVFIRDVNILFNGEYRSAVRGIEREEKGAPCLTVEAQGASTSALTAASISTLSSLCVSDSKSAGGAVSSSSMVMGDNISAPVTVRDNVTASVTVIDSTPVPVTDRDNILGSVPVMHSTPAPVTIRCNASVPVESVQSSCYARLYSKKLPQPDRLGSDSDKLTLLSFAAMSRF